LKTALEKIDFVVEDMESNAQTILESQEGIAEHIKQ
jgi:hypothetical protein